MSSSFIRASGVSWVSEKAFVPTVAVGPTTFAGLASGAGRPTTFAWRRVLASGAMRQRGGGTATFPTTWVSIMGPIEPTKILGDDIGGHLAVANELLKRRVRILYF